MKDITKKFTEILQKGDSNSFFIPPDNNDIGWESGSEIFTRQEVANLLWTQIAIIGNDLKTNCGNELTNNMYEIINNPRIPEF